MTCRSDPAAALYAVVLFIYVLALYPRVLHRTQEIGHDAPIYYEVGQGGQHRGFLYSAKTIPVFRWWAKLDYPAALAVLHLGNALGLAAIGYAALRRRYRYQRLAWAAALGVGVTAVLAVNNGNVTGMLAGLSLHPVGAVVAAVFKPWIGCTALVLHAVSRAIGSHPPQVRLSVRPDLAQGQSRAAGSAICSAGRKR